MTLVFCMKKKLSYLTFLKVMYVKKGINFRHDINSVEMNKADIHCRRYKYQLFITYNFFPHTLKIVWCKFKRDQKVLYGTIYLSIFFSCTNRFLTGSVDRTIRLWDLRTDQCQQTFWGHEADVTSLAFHPCGNNFVTCSEDKTSRSLLNYYNILAASLNYSALQNLLQTAKKLYNTIHTPFLHF